MQYRVLAADSVVKPIVFCSMVLCNREYLAGNCVMQHGRIPKDMLYGELVTGTRTADRPYTSATEIRANAT